MSRRSVCRSAAPRVPIALGLICSFPRSVSRLRRRCDFSRFFRPSLLLRPVVNLPTTYRCIDPTDLVASSWHQISHDTRNRASARQVPRFGDGLKGFVSVFCSWMIRIKLGTFPVLQRSRNVSPTRRFSSVEKTCFDPSPLGGFAVGLGPHAFAAGARGSAALLLCPLLVVLVGLRPIGLRPKQREHPR